MTDLEPRKGGHMRGGARARHRTIGATLVVLMLLTTLGVAASEPAGATAPNTTIPLTTFRDMLVVPSTGEVLASGDDSIFVYSSDGVYSTTIPNVYGAGGMDISGTSLWVAETTAAKLAEINLTTHQIVREVSVGVPVTSSSLAVIGGNVWFASNANLVRLDPSTATVSARGAVLNGQFEKVSSSTPMLLTYSLGDSVTKVDISTNPATRGATGSGGGNLRQIAVDPTRSTYTIASGSPYNFPEVSIPTMTLTGLEYPGIYYPSAISYSPGLGGLIAGSTQYSRTAFVSKVGQPATVASFALPGEQVERGISQSLDGSKVYALTQDAYAQTTSTKMLATFSTLPTVDAALPSEVVATVPTVVEVHGSNLDAVSGVKVAGIAAGIELVSSTTIRVTMPTNLTPGTRTLVVTTPTGTASIDLSVVPSTGATLTGVVQASSPLAGIALTLSGGGLGAPLSTTSAANGTYTFAGVPYGSTYTLQAHDPGSVYPDQSITGITLTPNLTSTLDVQLTTVQSGPGAVLASHALPGTPRDINVDPTTNRCFVSVGDELLAFDSSGNLLTRFEGMWAADGLARKGTDLYVNLRTAGRIVRINTSTLAVTGSWATTHPTTGGLAFAGDKAWFTNGNDQWVGISSLDPATGTVVDSPGSWYTPRFRNIDGTSSLFYAYEVGISSNAGYLMNGTASTASTITSAWGTGGGGAGSSPKNRLWVPGGSEYLLNNMQATGVTYPADGYRPVAYSAARGGVLGFGSKIDQVGTPQATHDLPSSPVVEAFDAGADRMFYATDTSFVVWDLHPHLVSVAPTPVYSDAASIDVTGTGLTTTSSVTVDGATEPFTVSGSNHLAVTVSGLTAGPHTVQATTAWGTSNSLSFTVTTRPPAPTVTSLTPTSRPTAGGTVTITGTGLTGASSVTFGALAVPFSVVNDTTITATVPAHQVAIVPVTVTTAGGTNAAPPTFSWVAPQPLVTGLSPTSGSVAGSSPVLITGQGFLFATAVSFGGTAASPFTVVNDTTISTWAPPHTAGAVGVTVTTAGGTSVTGAASTYTYVPLVPQVTQLTPSQGSIAGGYQVLIKGTRFSGVTGVTFGGVPAPSYTVVDASTIVAVAPPGPAGAALVRITTGEGSSADVSAAHFQYQSGASRFQGLVPARILDSRTATGGWNAPLAAGSPRTLVVGGAGGVPEDATSVVLNVTATDATADSFVTAYPAGMPTPTASNLNFTRGQTVANLVTVRVGDLGQVAFSTAVGTANVVVDVVGYYTAGAGDLYNALTPSRSLDSRTATGGWSGPLLAGDANVRTLQVATRNGVPAGATSVVLNLTATDASAASFIQVWPTGSLRPNSSNVNFAAGQTKANLVTVKLGTGGQLSFYNANGHANVVADVVGYFDPSSGNLYHPLVAPTRVLDDRIGVGALGPWGPGTVRSLALTGSNGIPGGAAAVVANATVTSATAGSYLTLFPAGVAVPDASNLNFEAGQTLANLAVVGLSGTGQLSIYNRLGSVDVIADVVGYYSSS